MSILQTRARQQGSRTVAQALVQWSDMAEDAATWEDMELLRLQFPRAPAWGQAGFQEEGIVSRQSPLGSDSGDDPKARRSPAANQERAPRRKRVPGWLATDEWAT